MVLGPSHGRVGFCLGHARGHSGRPSFVGFQRYGLTESFWAWLFGATGTARLVALYINGRWPTTPYIRMFGPLFGAISGAQVAWLVAEGTVFSAGWHQRGRSFTACSHLAFSSTSSVSARAYSPRASLWRC